ncbi:MAG: hypothetical protein WBB36_11200 [Chitinophagales bacterium]
MTRYKIIVLIGLFSFPTRVVLSQTNVDSITIVSKYSLYFLKNGKRLSPGKLVTAVKSNPEAYAILKHAKDSRDIGMILGCIGGFMVGYTVGVSFGERKLDKLDLAAGGALVLFSIPFSIGFSAKSYKAVKIYNAGIKETR